MQLKLGQFSGQLKQSLAGAYFISGDEPLQCGEVVDSIRKKARSEGFLNRVVLHVEGKFDWNQLRVATLNQSLFAEKNLIELNIPSGKPGVEGSKAITEVVEALSADNLLIIVSGKIDAKSKSSRWFKAIDGAGVIVQVWPVDEANLSQWVIERLHKKGLQIDRQAAKLLAERVEGNLLMANQEIEKLHVLYGEGQLGAEEILATVADNARYDVFKLTESLFRGEIERAVKILVGLRNEKIASAVVLWALSREIRLLVDLAFSANDRKASESIFRQNRVWDSKKSAYLKAIARADVKHWASLLQACSEADLVIKGAALGDEWNILEKICLGFCRPKAGLH